MTPQLYMITPPWTEQEEDPSYRHEICCDPDDHPLTGHRYPDCCSLDCPQCKEEGR